MIQYIKKNLPTTFVIAGNVGTPEAVRELENAGADATKVGIGPGKVCITKLKTGFGTGGWQLAAVRWCAKAATKPIMLTRRFAITATSPNPFALALLWL